MSSLWIREARTAPIGELYAQTLGEGEISFLYLGWAGIILRTNGHVLAFDLCRKNLKRGEVKDLERLNVQCYTHTHWDHWHAPHAKGILKRTGAPILIEPAIVGERGPLPAKTLTAVKPGEPIRVDDLTVSGIVGIHPRPITLFHVQGPDFRIFHGGDSGHVPLSGFKADIAFVPTGMPSPSCSPGSALAMVRELEAGIAVAMHGSEEQVREFKELAAAELPDVRVLTPSPCELLTVRAAE
jgi:L-ascorbate metabolism protein UlaG (beta-lactamase superfamily)